MISNDDFGQVNVCGIVPKLCLLNENYRKVFHEKIVLAKGQGACVEICRKSWLKKLRVAISTGASVPTGSSLGLDIEPGSAR
jgi:cobalamin biosynthesis protein CbiG